MLSEVTAVRQHPGESPRRLFTDDYLQLYVWLDSAGGVSGFELSYDVHGEWRAVRWKQGTEPGHFRVDEGESRWGKKAAPILIPENAPVPAGLAEEFRRRSSRLGPAIRAAVMERLV
jgi:hypothetical protein